MWDDEELLFNCCSGCCSFQTIGDYQSLNVDRKPPLGADFTEYRLDTPSSELSGDLSSTTAGRLSTPPILRKRRRQTSSCTGEDLSGTHTEILNNTSLLQTPPCPVTPQKITPLPFSPSQVSDNAGWFHVIGLFLTIKPKRKNIS